MLFARTAKDVEEKRLRGTSWTSEHNGRYNCGDYDLKQYDTILFKLKYVLEK